MNMRACLIAAGIGLALQLAMVLSGHTNPAIAQLFGPLGMGISLLAGVLYARLAGGSLGANALGGAVAGGACAFLGILVSWLLGDVTALILGAGTAASALAGAGGGALTSLVRKRAG